MSGFDALRPETQLCFPLYAASREAVKRYRPFLDALGLTYTQYITLLALWQESPLSVKALGSRLYLDSGTLTPVLKSMERDGLLRRRRSETDERIVLVTLTEAGEAKRAQAASLSPDSLPSLPLDADESALLRRLLRKILEHNTV